MAAKVNSNVFINCPFDNSYKCIFDAIVFAVFDCGFVPRSALEIIDTGQVRVDKILQIMDQCRFGYHDISRTDLDEINQLPRFNMPFELGLFLGLARQGGNKKCLVVDRDKYRYHKFLSDISGQDIAEHGNDPQSAVRVVRNWLRSSRKNVSIPGGNHIWQRYEQFRKILPCLCAKLHLEPSQLIFNDYTTIVCEWLKTHRSFQSEESYVE